MPMASLTLEDISHFSTIHFANEVISQVWFASFDGYVTSAQGKDIFDSFMMNLSGLNSRARLFNSYHFSSSLPPAKTDITWKEYDYLKLF